MIIDFHTHIGHSHDGSEQTIPELESNMKKLGIDKSVVFSIDDKDMSREELSFKIMEDVRGDDSLIPFFRFDPKKMKAENLERILKDFHGVKLHSRAEDFNPLDKKFFPLYEAIEKSGKPLLFHTKKYHLKQTDPAEIVRIAEEFPKLKLVLAHFAGSQPLVFNYVEKNGLGNVYFDTSVNCTQFYIRSIGEKLGFDRILFGSDCPYSDQEVELLKIKKLEIGDDDKNKILGLNAKKLLNL
ncbi:MAG: amidohydrolase [Candidatus Aenigmarchaeota archaeon]|nr:amidohydrolase [Candidatus Aenigmarchaeota archaeon]